MGAGGDVKEAANEVVWCFSWIETTAKGGSRETDEEDWQK